MLGCILQKLHTIVWNTCSYPYVKLYLIRWSFTHCIAKSLGGSLFFWAQCINPLTYLLKSKLKILKSIFQNSVPQFFCDWHIDHVRQVSWESEKKCRRGSDLKKVWHPDINHHLHYKLCWLQDRNTYESTTSRSLSGFSLTCLYTQQQWKHWLGREYYCWACWVLHCSQYTAPVF